MDYRYSNHVPRVQTSASTRGESCQAELCHVSCMNLLQHNEKTAVALHLIQFHPLALPLSNFLSVMMIIISNTPPVSTQAAVLHLKQQQQEKMVSPEHARRPNFSRGSVSRRTHGPSYRGKKHKRLRQTPQLFFGVFSNKDSSSGSK